MPRAVLKHFLFLFISMAIAGCQGDRMIKLSKGMYLSWDGINWALLDGRNRGVGIENTEGGIVIVSNVNSISVIPARYIIGKTDQGRFFVVSLNPGDSDTVQWFESEVGWIDHLRSLGIKDVQLKPPTSF